jgi:hypothetical protein
MLGNNISSGSTKPAFLWVLRDMQLQMKQEPKQEMTEKLDDSHPQAGMRNLLAAPKLDILARVLC